MQLNDIHENRIRAFTSRDDVDNDSISNHSYIDVNDWNPNVPASNQVIHEVQLHPYQSRENSDTRRKPLKEIQPQIPMGLLKELPSRNLGLPGPSSGATMLKGTGLQGMNSVTRSGTLRLKCGNAALRQSDLNEDQLYNALKSDTEATEDQIKETLRNINQSLTLKRSVKARLSHDLNQRKKHHLSCWKRLKYRIAMTWQHAKHELKETCHSLDLWHSHLKTVQGHFGSGVASYFFFLRWLFYLNVLAFIILLAFVVTPQLLWLDQTTNNDTTGSDETPKFTGLELLTGTGFFNNSILYYGGYTDETVGDLYAMPEAYLFANSAYIVCCMLFLSYSLAKSYRQNHIETSSDINNKYANKVFSAWDYSIESENAARLKARSIYNELMELIESESDDDDPRTLGEKLYIYFWRAFINIIILGSMGSLGYLVHFLLDHKYVDDVDILFLREMTLALVVTAILFIVPIAFTFMSKWEGYTSKQAELYLNMLRTVVLRIVVLGVVTYFWLKISAEKISNNDAGNINSRNQCWESELGQEVYRLIIVNLICVLLFSTFIMELLRRICYDLGLKCVGKPEFDIAQNTLDLIYIQTLTWVGVFYCPLLPLVTLIKLVVIFYTKRLSVVQNCRPSLKPWKGAHTQTVFLALTFANFILAMISLGYSILVIRPSEDCGPFRNMKTRYDVVLSLLSDFQNDTQLLEILFSPGAVCGFLLFLAVVVYYTRASSKAYGEMVNLLRDQLIMEGKDKVFLLQLFETAMHHRSASGSGKEKLGLMASSQKSAEPPKPVSPYNSGESSTVNETYMDYPLPQEEMFSASPVTNRGTSHHPSYSLGYMPADVPANNRLSDPTTVLDPAGLVLPQPKPGWGRNREKTPEAWALEDRRGSSRSNNSTPSSDKSPFSIIPEHVRSASPVGSWDRRRSQTPRRGPVPPPLGRPTHQQGFQYLTQDSPSYSPTRSRQNTPQRF